MATVHRTCPECRSPLGLSRLPRGGQVRCPICDAVIDCLDEVEDEGAVRPAPGPAATAQARG